MENDRLNGELVAEKPLITKQGCVNVSTDKNQQKII